jgi:hypothetical protein
MVSAGVTASSSMWWISSLGSTAGDAVVTGARRKRTSTSVVAADAYLYLTLYPPHQQESELLFGNSTNAVRKKVLTASVRRS